MAVPEQDLPVLLPMIEAFRPAGTGVSPLAADRAFVETRCPACGGPGRRETDVSDTFVDSSWYFLRYPSSELDDRAWDPDRCRPVDFYAGGPEHVQRHHLYARFMTMALSDLGLVPFEEPFPHVRLGGLLIKEGAKMSKSRGNVVGPDPYVATRGADVLRCALLFTCPWEQGGDFHDTTIAGIERFFTRAWAAIGGPTTEERPTPAIEAAIDAVSTAVERLRFNVALARLMEIVDRATSPRGKRVFVQLLAPFAPHLAEELWSRLGEPFSVHESRWPTADRALLDRQRVTVVVQVDGRVRGTVPAARDATQEDVVAAARELAGVEPSRVVYVPGRVVNLVR